MGLCSTRRFGLFPFAMFSLTFLAAVTLGYVGIGQFVLHMLVLALPLVLGLQSGLPGVEGADTVRGLSGDVTLLVCMTL